jgi:uncharacterized protein (TIGR03437 family)
VSQWDVIAVSARTNPGTPQGESAIVTAHVTTATNDPNTDDNVSTAGFNIGGVPPFSVAPSSISFPSIPAGSIANGSFTVTPNNAVDIELRLTSSTGAPPPHFALPQGARTSFRLASAQAVSVEFRPAAAGQGAGQLDVAAPDAGFVLTVDLQGTATGQAAIPVISEVTDGAGFRPAIAANAWVAIKGTNLASATRTWQAGDFSGNLLPTALDGTFVNINGRPAYVYFISPAQINALAPADASTGSVAVQVVTPAGQSTVQAQKNDIAPGVFTYPHPATSRLYAAAQLLDFTTIARPGTFLNATTRAARPGDAIILYLSGLGPTDPAYPDGTLLSPVERRLVLPVSVRIGGMTATQNFAGMSTLPGLYQINTFTPDLPNGDHEIRVTVDGRQTQPSVFLPVER